MGEKLAIAHTWIFTHTFVTTTS